MKNTIFLIFCLISFRAVATPLEPSKTVTLQGEIGRSAIPFSKLLVDVADKSDGSINMIINSPGGSIIAGNFIINSMEYVKGRGVKINCFVADIAASMAYSILLHCSERTALSHSMLL